MHKIQLIINQCNYIKITIFQCWSQIHLIEFYSILVQIQQVNKDGCQYRQVVWNSLFLKAIHKTIKGKRKYNPDHPLNTSSNATMKCVEDNAFWAVNFWMPRTSIHPSTIHPSISSSMYIASYKTIYICCQGVGVRWWNFNLYVTAVLCQSGQCLCKACRQSAECLNL